MQGHTCNTSVSDQKPRTVFFIIMVFFFALSLTGLVATRCVCDVFDFDGVLIVFFVIFV